MPDIFRISIDGQKKNKKDTVPFGPFMYVGYVVTIILGMF